MPREWCRNFENAVDASLPKGACSRICAQLWRSWRWLALMVGCSLVFRDLIWSEQFQEKEPLLKDVWYKSPVLSSPPPIPAGLARVLQDSSGLCPTLPSFAKLGRTGTELGRISARIKYIMENSQCHVTLSNNSLYTDNLIQRIPQIFSFKERKLNCIQ